jgi:class 3 adenylate cyclase
VSASFQASRLCSAAKAGEIIISENTSKEVKSLFNLEDHEPILAKGKDQPVKVFGIKGKLK